MAARSYVPCLAASVLLACGSPPATEAPEPAEPAPVDPTQRPIPEIDVASLPVVDAVLGVPPLAAPPVDRDAPAHVRVTLEVQETTREIADGVKVGAQSGVHRALTKPGATYFGTPAYPQREAMRIYGSFPQLPDLLATVRDLQKRLEKLEPPTPDPGA